MYFNKHILIIFSLIVFITSCEDVIQLDLNNGVTTLVVNGFISDQPGPYTINLSRSGNYFESNTFVAETGAIVIISDNEGGRDTLKEKSAGSYNTTHIQGTPGKTYTLSITTGDKKIYTAASYLPPPVPIDSIHYEVRIRNGFGPPSTSTQPQSYQASCYYTDPASTVNYYRFKFYKNDTLSDPESYFIANDLVTNGQSVSQRIRGRFALNDSIKADMFTMDKNGYDFYNDLQKLINDQTSIVASNAPSNPINNISNGALGYFGAYGITSKKISIH